MKCLSACLLGCLYAASAMVMIVDTRQRGRCKRILCHAPCPYGRAVDQHGCQLCECNPNPCDTHKCPEGSECHVKEMKPCQDGDCDASPVCSITPLCKGRRGQHKLQCDQEGSFLPIQCHRPEGALNNECWCVNDRGQEVTGSRMSVQKEKDMPDCVYNRTVRVHIQFFMRHDYDQVEVHLGRIKEAVHHHITEWLMVDKEYIINLQVSPHTHQAKLVVVEFEVVRQGRLDLAATAVHFKDHMDQGRCHFEDQGHHMQADPSSFHIYHTYGPDEKSPPDNHWSLSWIWKHRPYRTVFILGVSAACLVLILIVFVSVVVKQDRIQQWDITKPTGKGATFKQNLAFSNQRKDQTRLEGDLKRNKQQPISSPTVEAKPV